MSQTIDTTHACPLCDTEHDAYTLGCHCGLGCQHCTEHAPVTPPQGMRYSNPRLTATIDNWPSGRHRVTALFSVETHPTRGQRGIRQTTHPVTGRMSAPKKLTYAAQVRIVEGDDGRTYLAGANASSYSVTIMQSNMQFQQERITNDDPRYAAVLALFA